MFTGLVQEIGRLRRLTSSQGVLRLDVEAPRLAAQAKMGQSIAVNGICLTVTKIRGRVFQVDAAGETQRLTTLKFWRPGRLVHLESALKVGDAMDGHMVQGHIDGTGQIVAVKKSGGGLLMEIGLAKELAQYLTPKGSVAVDGVSLTVDSGPFVDRFSVNLIPHTLRSTCFNGIKYGQAVNLEMDVLVKAARHGEGMVALASDRTPEMTMERLLARGFGRRAAKGNQ